jgi:lactose/L-arabinose transport system substrate-binding protein
MKKIVWIVLSLVVLSLVGCAGKSISMQQAPQIIIWTWDETFNVKAAKLAADEYMQNNDVDIVVETMEREEILSSTKKILAAGAYDKLPDIIMLEDYDVADVLSTYEDEFVNLTDRVDYDKFADYKSNLCSRSDQKYGIPFDSGAAALFYRIDILEQVGFSESDMENLTWDEFIDIGMQVYEKTGVSMLTLDPSDFPVLRLIMQSCGKWYVTSDGKAADIEKNDALQQG